MNRIETVFKKAKDEGRACFISYVCAGDPNFETSLNVCRALIEEGTDILELGVPFSDPLADGLTNQLAAERALRSGITQAHVYRLTQTLRKEFPEVPIVFYTYYNLAFSNGIQKTVDLASEAGVDAFLTLDLPPEEADEMTEACSKAGIESIFIIAPTSSEERIRLICEKASGFIYYVSQEGVTGERTEIARDLGDKLSLIRKYAKVPVVVGFGISQPEHVKTVASVADGVVVGSALVNCIAGHSEDSEAAVSAIRDKLSQLVKGLTL